jgi:hypothetical protein
VSYALPPEELPVNPKTNARDGLSRTGIGARRPAASFEARSKARFRGILGVAALLVLPGCGLFGGSGSGGGGGGGAAGDLAPAKAVQGNVMVTLRTYHPNAPTTTMALVNASSESGRRLASGKATSREIRVITDDDMGRLLAEMDRRGFSGQARAGLTLAQLTDNPSRRGVILVEENGSSRGIEFSTGAGGTALPTVYTECKKLVWGVHMAVPGFEVRATTDNAMDAENVFQAPPARLPRR